MMTRLKQRRRINKGAKMVNEVNSLYKQGRIAEAEKLKQKFYSNPEPLYWIMQRSYELRDRAY